MTPIEALLLGLGGALSILPGISSVGTVTSIGMVCGADRSFSLNTALLLGMPITIGLIVFDIIAIAANGVGLLSFGLFLCYILAAAAAVGGVLLAVKIMRALAKSSGFAIFGLYSWTAALLSVILYLTI